MFEKKKEKAQYLLLKGKYLWLLIKRFRVLLIALCVAGGLFGGIITYCIYTPEYTVTQAFTIELAEHPGANYATINDNQLSKTIPVLLSCDTFINHMKPYMKASGIKGSFRVTSLDSSNIFYLTATSDSNDSSMQIIDEIQKHYGDIADRVIGKSTMKFMAPPAYNSMPSNAPDYTISIGLSVLAVFLAFMAALLLKTRFTKTVTSAEETEKEINAPCLATIHQVYRKRRSIEGKKNKTKIPLTVNEGTGLEFRQEISTLSASLDKICRENGYKSILVTSTASGEGKSSVSLNLACDLADRGKRVIILDCDLRTPCIAENLGITDIQVPLSTAIRSGMQSYSFINQTDIDNLFFAGNIDGEPTSFENSADSNFKALVDGLKENFDYIIFDSPPSGFLGDALEIGEIADGFIYVIAHNSISKSCVLRSLSSFDGAKCKMLGFVINHM